ncbi:MAG: GAF domain-containing protein [Desulfuromonadales bacterium]|nr:GAF domain-containing protein [Desulfuromonadales bacterium]
MRRPPLGSFLSLPLRVALLYCLFGALWILFSDRLLFSLTQDAAHLAHLQTWKGWLFIAVTGVGLFFLVRHYVDAVRRRETILREVASAVAGRTGEAYFRTLVKHLAGALQVEYALVGERTGDGERIRTLAVWMGDHLAENFDYERVGTPCAETLANSSCQIEAGAHRRYPDDPLLQKLGVESYFGFPLLDGRGEPLGLLAVMDRRPFRQASITEPLMRIFAVRAATELERQRDQLALQTQFSQISSIFDSLNALVYVVDPQERRLLYLNRFGEELFGPDWHDKGCCEVLREAEDSCLFCASNQELDRNDLEPQPVLWERQNRHTQRWYQCIDKAIRWPDGRLVRLEIAIDITERKEVERLKDEILSAVSHEMRTPLTAILGYAEFLLDNELEADQQRPCLEILSREAEKLSELIGDFLQLQRLQARRQSFRFQPLLVGDLLQKAVRPFATFNDRHRFRLEIAADLPPVNGEERGLLDAIDQLISNAVKFSPDGGEIVVGSCRREAEVLIWVRDAGKGMGADELERIFQPFYRIDNTDRREAGGAGLGLALVRELVREHGGRSWAESVKGEGSSFYIALPAIAS